jgi:hypothetical protein
MKFDKPAALNRDIHRELRFQPTHGFGFAAGLHAALLGVSEFFAAAKEYAIVFVRTDSGEPLPVVVLGLQAEENLFISRDGDWTARYLPASVRSYPFAVIEAGEGGSLQILIDEACPGFGVTEGSALFTDSGAPAPELQSKLQFLQAHQADMVLTRRFGAELKNLGLLTERSAQLRVGEQAPVSLNGFWLVDDSKLNALDDADLLRLARQGHLALITAHLLSIGNLGLLAPKLKPAADRVKRSTAKIKAGAHAKA